jgi:DNA-binding MarR family transcriptional regulator
MNRNSLSDFSEEVSLLIPKLMQGVFKRQADALGKGTITIPQYVCMDLIGNRGPVMMKDIALALDITLPAASGFIDRLYITDFVKRVFEPTDRRIVRIVLTEKGKRAVKEVKEKRKAVIKEVFSHLSEGERQQYLKILKKVVGNLNKKPKAKK